MPRYAQYDKSFNGYRLFIGNIGERVGKYDLEAEFDKFGPLIDIWVARNPPGFAYVVYKHRDDAEYAVRKLHGRYVCGKQVRVEFAKPYPGPPPNINYVPRHGDKHKSSSSLPYNQAKVSSESVPQLYSIEIVHIGWRGDPYQPKFVAPHKTLPNRVTTSYQTS
ncbi:putative serine/arginine-rich splicing factor 7 isoform X1 [Apostichopus japonicus]|uniref:Putative serine/arginine-rich splicing factor 7 isoform X1 n=1 Tax=Stichopus japonicus TaxID=307972 RepID=A0A2G8L7W2_STIJA|nr:putative serine/arginine-rich splicing factor 7 isoform X1 [Apostichopus japonicus]